MLSGPARLLRLAGAVVAAAAVLVLFPAVASAHTEFEGSDPQDGAQVTAPLERVTVSFTNPATPSGDGIVLLDEAGAEVPATLEEDGTSFVLVPDRPPAAGTYGVRWEVRAGDAHPIDGSFTFTVLAASPSPSGSQTSAPAPTASATSPAGLDDALGEGGTAWAEPVRAVSRVLVTAGAMVAVGGLVALLLAIRGRPEELRAVLAWVRVAGALVALGGALRLAVLLATVPGGPGEAWASSLGVASGLRVVGGLALAFGLPAGAVLGSASRGRHASTAEDGHQWRGWGASVLGLVGAGLVVVAFWFDGHTVSRGPWALHAGINAVHVTAAAVWSGGLVVLAALVWRRHHRGEAQDGAWLVARFSRVAGLALGAVVLAGAALAVVVLETPSDLWASPWGRVLLAKTAVVGVAALLGAVVHLRLRPALEARPAAGDLAVRVRRSFSAEAAAFLAVIALTSWLVAATT